MQINNNHFVSLHFRLTDDSGELIESTFDGAEPMQYLHGRQQMPRGFEAAIESLATGDQLTFSLRPAEAYGLRSVEKKQRVPIKYLTHEGPLSAGKQVHINTKQGIKPGTIIKVGKFNADVDMSHPLAGKNLHFDVEVLAVRKASAEEIAHGHSHAEGNCGH
ncbi:MAG: peptidylprolyl isomerase [Porticoccaceae bacterium]|nr:peptidylprolyl isomerase [Porticoccaceae bacterium]